MSTRVVVADSSMLIDVERGCVDAAPFALGFDVCVPDLLYERELLAYGDRLLVLGLKVLELDGAGVLQAVVVSRFVSWNPQGSSPVCSVDGLPGMTEQSGKRLESVPSPFS